MIVRDKANRADRKIILQLFLVCVARANETTHIFPLCNLTIHVKSRRAL